MIRARIEHAHAVLVDVLRDLDLTTPHDRAVFAECLAAARRLGEARDLCPEAAEHEPLLQVA